MGRWWNRIVLFLIVGLTAFSVWTIWPSEPDRYLPDAVPWPEGKGVEFSFPWFEGGTFGLRSIERRAMSLGLDLRGGTRLVLAPEEGFTAVRWRVAEPGGVPCRDQAIMNRAEVTRQYQ